MVTRQVTHPGGNMLTTGDVAKLFHVSAQTVINWLDQGRIPFERIGKGPRRLTENNVLRYIQEVGISVEALDEGIYDSIMKKVSTHHSTGLQAVVVLNRDARVVSWNEGAAEVFGFSSLEMLGASIEKIPTKVSTGGNLENILRGHWESPALELELAQVNQDGDHIRTRAVASRYYGEAAMLEGFVLTYKVL